MMTNKLRFGLVGCGQFGPELASYIDANPRAEVAAVVDPREDSWQNVSTKLRRKLPGFKNITEMLHNVDVDAVAITSPNFTHRDIAVEVAEAGKHIFCEKAMAINTSQCWDMVDAAEKHKVRLMVGHKRRLRPPWARMIEITHSGELGKPVAVNVTGYHLDVYSTGWWFEKERVGGLFWVAGVHSIDWMRGMCGEAASVTALAAHKQDARRDYPDIISALISFYSGAVGSIQVALNYPLHKFREAFGPQVVCERGGMRLLPALDHITLEWQQTDAPQVHREYFTDLGFTHAFTLEIDDFIAWVLDGRPPSLTWHEGLRCVEIMEAANLSVESGAIPIRLPLCPERER